MQTNDVSALNLIRGMLKELWISTEDRNKKLADIEKIPAVVLYDKEKEIEFSMHCTPLTAKLYLGLIEIPFNLDTEKTGADNIQFDERYNKLYEEFRDCCYNTEIIRKAISSTWYKQSKSIMAEFIGVFQDWKSTTTTAHYSPFGAFKVLFSVRCEIVEINNSECICEAYVQYSINNAKSDKSESIRTEKVVLGRFRFPVFYMNTGEIIKISEKLNDADALERFHAELRGNMPEVPAVIKKTRLKAYNMFFQYNKAFAFSDCAEEAYKKSSDKYYLLCNHYDMCIPGSNILNSLRAGGITGEWFIYLKDTAMKYTIDTNISKDASNAKISVWFSTRDIFTPRSHLKAFEKGQKIIDDKDMLTYTVSKQDILDGKAFDKAIKFIRLKIRNIETEKEASHTLYIKDILILDLTKIILERHADVEIIFNGVLNHEKIVESLIKLQIVSGAEVIKLADELIIALANNKIYIFWDNNMTLKFASSNEINCNIQDNAERLRRSLSDYTYNRLMGVSNTLYDKIKVQLFENNNFEFVDREEIK